MPDLGVDLGGNSRWNEADGAPLCVLLLKPSLLMCSYDEYLEGFAHSGWVAAVC